MDLVGVDEEKERHLAVRFDPAARLPEGETHFAGCLRLLAPILGVLVEAIAEAALANEVAVLREGCSSVARCSQSVGEGDGVRELAVEALQDAVMDGVEAREQAHVRRAGRDRRGDRVLEEGSAPGDRVEKGRSVTRVSVGSEAAGAQCVE
jgi:hypothetical protein